MRAALEYHDKGVERGWSSGNRKEPLLIDIDSRKRIEGLIIVYPGTENGGMLMEAYKLK